jgi:hypothetical protein
MYSEVDLRTGSFPAVISFHLDAIAGGTTHTAFNGSSQSTIINPICESGGISCSPSTSSKICCRTSSDSVNTYIRQYEGRAAVLTDSRVR